MADSFSPKTAQDDDNEDEDYMGDLSQFIPPETAQPPKAQFKKVLPINPNSPLFDVEQQSRSFSITMEAIESPKLARTEESLKRAAATRRGLADPSEYGGSDSTIEHRVQNVETNGLHPGFGTGKEGSGRAEPVGLEIRRTRAGIGREDPIKEKMRREEAWTEKKRKNEAALMAEFGCRQKSQWQSRRVVVNFKKAKGALDQLENKEIVEPKKKEDEDSEEGEEEEEEEEITEEDLQNILMKLRDEFRYCLFCGCQYESVEALLSNCPGPNEDDH
ncbi:G patch domain-containing protein 11 [Vitis vinifera]|uniref:G patch domain-containing protein 11 n=1 Tax=Vitis vinifera TaxID=29760 RepID=A0A438D5F3_VITVI|nr:G patch domain-containing protein 11 [Vitis vinifera]